MAEDLTIDLNKATEATDEGANALPHKGNAEVRRKDLADAECQQTP